MSVVIVATLMPVPEHRDAVIAAIEKAGGSVTIPEIVPAADKAAAKKGVKYKERQAHKASFKA